MIKKHERFDQDFLMKIKKIIEEHNLKKGRKFLLEYMNMYPTDEWAKIEYITLLRKEGNLEEAEQYIDSLKNFKAISFLDTEKYFIAFAKGDYQKAYELLPKIERKIIEEDDFVYDGFTLNKIFLEKKMGTFDTSKKLEIDGYLISQVANYNKERALAHIYKHKCKNKNKEKHLLFEEEINIDELFNQIQKRLNDKTIIQDMDSSITQKYIFEYPISYKDDCNYKYLKVVVIRDTTDIVTMFPLITKNKIEPVNPLNPINPIKEESTSRQKVKRLSRIEKFNQKYSNFV